MGLEQQPSDVALKRIEYRGGIARFQVPSTWIEEYEPEGGGTFYQPGEDTGTLRVHVMDFERPSNGATPQSAFELLTSLKGVGEVDALASGIAIGRSATPANERGVDLRIYSWHVGVRVAPTHFRIVVFTYTILAKQEHEPTTIREVELLDRSVRNGEYPAVPGISGNYFHQ